MGLFDTVIIEGLKLKAPKEVDNFLASNNAEFPDEFQTKDLGSYFTTYFINKDGQIYENVRKPTGKMVPYKPFSWDWKDNRSFLERLYFNAKHKKISEVDGEEKLVEEYKTVKQKSKITNTFDIYSYDKIGDRYVELEYQVKAVEGFVQSVKLLKYSIESDEDAAERNQRDVEFKTNMDKQISKRKEFHSKWYYPLIKETYNPFVFFTKLLVQNICNKLVAWSYRWTGV